MTKQRQIPDEISQALASWQFKAYSWNALHFTLGIAALISMPVTHFLSHSQPGWIDSNYLHAACAANVVLVSLVTFFQARRQARIYWQAFYHLDIARIHFLAQPNASEQKLWKAMIEAEQSIPTADGGYHLPSHVPLIEHDNAVLGVQYATNRADIYSNGDNTGRKTAPADKGRRNLHADPDDIDFATVKARIVE